MRDFNFQQIRHVNQSEDLKIQQNNIHNIAPLTAVLDKHIIIV